MDLAYHSLNLRTQAPQERCLSGLGPAGVSLTVPATGQILIENGQEKKKNQDQNYNMTQQSQYRAYALKKP